MQLASKLDVSQRAISRLETVAEYPTVPLLVAICEVLGASADELLGLKSPPKAAATRQPPEEKLARRLREAQRLPRRDRDALLRTLDAFLSRSPPDSGRAA